MSLANTYIQRSILIPTDNDNDDDMDLDLPPPPPQPSSTTNSPHPATTTTASHHKPSTTSSGVVSANLPHLSTPAKIAHLVRSVKNKANTMSKVWCVLVASKQYVALIQQ